ncbi:hypothetical protein EDB81DRAFT_808444 [Dactylonectria macrodidyma]|uniref:DUF6604 domain-containing protein n=1 Tax=Dactylonectria macrodidyma TaxID=307937 RepID=A0A9P9E2R9_9HYPO|nr:hypothetical protein EDB81DRAFT_808444 [Dactylonectria macrodidyma]
MLSGNFLSTYQKYKRDTDVVATWLVATAKQRGYDGPLDAPGPASASTKSSSAPSSGRLKGKARKEAKQQQRKQAVPSNKDAKDAKEASFSPPKVKHVLAIRDFVPLAEFIAGQVTATQTEADQSPGIPSSLMTALERTIRVRKSFSARLNKVQQNLSNQPDASHAHFVSVLERVCHVLRQCAVGSGDTSETAPLDAATKAVRNGSTKRDKPPGYNIFDLLEVFEPSDDFSTEPDVVAPAPSSLPIDLEYTPEYNEDSEAECIFAFTALLKDLFSLREEIRDLWQNYSSGKLDLAATAVGVNMALELARSMEEEMAPLLKKHGGAIALLPKIFDGVCQSLGINPLKKELPSDDMNFACYDIGASFLWNVASLLDAIRITAPRGSQAMPRYTGSHGWFDAQTAHLETMTNRERWAQDKAALLEVVPDLDMLFELKGVQVHDEFARGFQIMFKTQQVPLWLCFAAQNYLDTLRLLGPDVKKPLEEFYYFNESMASVVDRAAKVKHSDDVDKELDNLCHMASVTKNGVDIFTAYRKALYHGSGYESENWTSSFLLHNPVFCGLWIHYGRVRMHQTGAKYHAKPGAVLHSVQLYTAIQQQQQLQNSASVLEWPEADNLVAIQGPEAFFVGREPPASPQAYLKNYCMCRGISPANWLAATKRRKAKMGKTPLLTSGAGTRRLRLSAPASLWCAKRTEKLATADPTRRAWNAEAVQQILEACGWSKGREEDKEGDEASGIGESRAEVAAHVNTKAKTKGKAKSILTASQLVHEVAHVIHTEVPDLTFDYFAIHGTAQRLLEELREQADYIGLPSVAWPMTDVADFAGVIFATAAGELMPDSKQREKVMGMVAEVMRASLMEELEGTLLSPTSLVQPLRSKMTL